MNANDSIKSIDDLMTEYRNKYNRAPMHDMAIWHTLVNYYESPEDYDIVATSTKEEAFERMVADNWRDTVDFYGLDYETIDEQVLDYLVKNQLVTEVESNE